MSQIPVSQPDGSVVMMESNDAIVTHCADASGAYLGAVQPGVAAFWIAGPPPDARTGWRWDFDDRAWRRTPPLAEVKLRALRDIDATAGAARLRYVTDSPGLSVVYVRKLDQAKAYAAAGYAGTVPPYIAAEAAATGQSATTVADAIIAAAATWDDAKSPAIEGARIKGKRAVTTALTAIGAKIAAAAATNELEAL